MKPPHRIMTAFTGTTLREKTLAHVEISSHEHHRTDHVPSPMLPIDLSILIDAEEAARQPASRKCVYAYEDKYTFARILVSDSLVFDSHFESGNLHSAFRVFPEDVKMARNRQIYDLYMHNDLYTNGHTQWFYFSVTNVRAGDEVTFYIKNFAKPDSLFNAGMRPLMYSGKSGKGWERCGTNIAYFPTSSSGTAGAMQQQAQQQQQQPQPPTPQNQQQSQQQPQSQPASSTLAAAPDIVADGQVAVGAYSQVAEQQASASASQKAAKKPTVATNYTLAFTHIFERNDDVCYFAFCHPYTYTDLQNYLYRLQVDSRRKKHMRKSVLCKTIAGNNCDLLTITAPSRSSDALRARVVIFLTARVHPGESNASWIMQGMIDFLTSEAPEAVQLRERYIFKVIPMLNPDGVINGNYRTSLSGVDLNRKWSHPDVNKHPTIFHTKELIRHVKENWQVGLVLDVHGHSRKQGVFFYGCVPDRKLMRPPSPPYYLAAKDQSSDEQSAEVLTLFATLDTLVPSPPLAAQLTDSDATSAVQLQQPHHEQDHHHRHHYHHQQQQQSKSTSWNIPSDPPKNLNYPNKSCTLRDVLAWRVKLLPRILDATVPLFSLESCSFKMQKGKASTMRMVAFTELGVDCVYTIEASLAGKEPYHFGAGDLINLGRELSNSLLTLYPSLAPRSSPHYSIPIVPSVSYHSSRDSLSMFANEMSFWKQLYEIETCSGSGASLLSETGILEVTAKDDQNFTRNDEFSCAANDESDRESAEPPPPPSFGTPMDPSMSGKGSKKDKAKAKGSVNDVAAGEGKGNKKGVKPWKAKAKRAINQLAAGDSSNWCFDATGIAFPSSKGVDKKRDMKFGSNADDGVLDEGLRASPETFMSSFKTFLVSGGAAATSAEEFPAAMSRNPAKRPSKDTDSAAPGDRGKNPAGSRLDANRGEASFQVSGAGALISSPVSLKAHTQKKSENLDKVILSSEDTFRKTVAAPTIGVSMTRLNRRPSTASVETISRHLYGGNSVGGETAVMSRVDPSDNSLVLSKGAGQAAKKPRELPLSPGIHSGPAHLKPENVALAGKKSMPGDLSKHIMETLRDRNSKCARSRFSNFHLHLALCCCAVC